MKSQLVIAGGVLLCLGFTQCKNTEQTAQQPPANHNQNQQQSRQQGPLKNDFSKIDTDGDGFLSRAEIEAAPKPQGRPQPR